MKSQDSEPCYVISIAARMVGVQAHTVRYYERQGLVNPSRSEGNIRLYSEEDIGRIRHVKTLMEELGLNLAGVEVILRMSERMAEMKRQLEEKEAEIRRLEEKR